MAFIFVYGTLRKAYRHLNVYTNLFHEGAEWVADAQVSGTLYLMDWYPALKMNGNELVYGELYAGRMGNGRSIEVSARGGVRWVRFLWMN